MYQILVPPTLRYRRCPEHVFRGGCSGGTWDRRGAQCWWRQLCTSHRFLQGSPRPPKPSAESHLWPAECSHDLKNKNKSQIKAETATDTVNVGLSRPDISMIIILSNCVSTSQPFFPKLQNEMLSTSTSKINVINHQWYNQYGVLHSEIISRAQYF